MSPLPPAPLSAPPAPPAPAAPRPPVLPARRGWIVLALACWLLSLPVQAQLAALPEGRMVLVDDPFAKLPPADALVEFIGTNVLGGFKAIFLDYLWLRYDQLKHDERYEEAYVLCKVIIFMQPRYLEVVDFLAWDVAYNLPNLMDNDEDRWKYCREGIGIYDEGLRLKERFKLRTQRGYTFYHRIGPEPFFNARTWKEYGRGPYEIALADFKRAEANSEAAGVSYWRYHGLMIECAVDHAFDLVRRGEYDKASEWLDSTGLLIVRLIEYSRKMSQGWAPPPWEDRLKSLPLIREAFGLERSLVEARAARDFGRAAELQNQVLTAYSRLLNDYPNTINRPISVQFKGHLINSVEPLLADLQGGNPATLAAVDGVFAQADAWLKRISAPLPPNPLDPHPGPRSRPDIQYWMEAIDQFEELRGAYRAEFEAWRLVRRDGAPAPTDEEQSRAKRLFESVLGTYEKLWNYAAFRQDWFDAHRERLKKILGLN